MPFRKVTMFDDGNHNDGLANDGLKEEGKIQKFQ